MRAYALSHLSDRELLRDLVSLVAEERATTAALLAHLAEFDARRLYLPAAYPSLYAYCVQELHFSEQAAFKRIQAARAARQFPAIFSAVADGRLHLSAVVLLAPYLTAENADQLLFAAGHKTKSEIEALIAARFQIPEVAADVGAVSSLGSTPNAEQLSPGIVEPLPTPHAPGHVGPRAELAPVAPERIVLRLTIAASTQDKLRYAQELLGHQIPSGDLAQVLDRALDLAIAQLEKRKFAATARPRPTQHPSGNPRHIPAEVKRAVWQRDGASAPS